MPKQTFLNLSEEKKDKIIKSAKKEFSRVPLSEASIQNIVQDAEIARGSFYQYFENKEDLMQYIVENATQHIFQKMIKKLTETKDLFQTYLSLYDEIIKNTKNKENRDFYKMFFESIRPDDNMLENIRQNVIKKKMKYLVNIIPETDLKYKSLEDVKIMLKMLNAITIQAIARSVKDQKNEKQSKREEYIRELEFVKYGVLKSQ